MNISFELTEKESYSRQLTALWNGGFGADVLSRMLPEISKLEEAHYLKVANSATVGKQDSRFAIESGSLLDELTHPIVRNESIILETSLDYALSVERRALEIGESLLPSEAEVLEVLQRTLSKASLEFL